MLHAPTRRSTLAALAVLAACSLLSANAQTPSSPWPNRAVKFVNSWPAGGPSDILARAVGDVLQKQYGQPFVIDNKPGAAGNLGADLVAKSAPDGHTLVWGIDTTHTINPHIYKSMPFKDSELKPLVILSSSGLLLGVHPSTGLKNARDWLQAARERSLNFSSGGNGSPGHLWVNMANIGAATRLVHVPYRGNTPAVMAVLSGEVDGGTLATPGMLPHVKAGKITPLAVTSRKRSRLAPDVPTVAESGGPALEVNSFVVLVAPKGIAPEVRDRIHADVQKVLADPDIKARYNTFAFEALNWSPAEIVRQAELKGRTYGKLVQRKNISLE